MSGPLHDIRVIAIEQYGAGPWGTLQLADLGAEVIKIEDPAVGGDVGRYVPPFQTDEDSLFFETFNRNKKSISLNLRIPESRKVFEDLVAGSDAVYSNLRGDQSTKLGLTYADLAHVNQRIVCCSLSAFGRTGPRAAQPGYDYIVQGLAGWMTLTGEPDSGPIRAGPPVVDLAGGYASVIALLAGVWQARRDGRGCDCDISLFETALQQLVYVATWAATEDYVTVRRAHSGHPSIVPFQNFSTADGWIVVACPKEVFWRRLCGAIERPDLETDERYIDFAGRNEYRSALVAELRDVFATRKTADWLECLAAAGVPHGPINSVAEALADEQVESREGLVEISHPRLGTIRQVASALRVEGTERPLVRAPSRGEHTRDVLETVCGYPTAEIDRLCDLGVFGDGKE